MINIKIITLGRMPPELDLRKISSWKSQEFTIGSEIEGFTIKANSDGINWEFTDKNIKSQLPVQETFDEDFLIVIVNVPIELNWYSRRLDNNRVVFSFYEIKDILADNNIPLENIIYILLYKYTLRYKGSNKIIPENTNFTHDETLGCLFDMNGIKKDIVYSCNNPIICDSCISNLKNARVSDNVLNNIKSEIKKIKKPLFFRISDFVKKHPICSLFISMVAALLSGVVGSLIATMIHEVFIK